jgi:hypothetical protein
MMGSRSNRLNWLRIRGIDEGSGTLGTWSDHFIPALSLRDAKRPAARSEDDPEP